MYELAFTSKKPVPNYVKQVKANFFQQCALKREKLGGLNQAWVYTRNTPNKAGHRLSRSTASEAERSRVDWFSCYSHSIIPAPVKEPNTVYTCLKSQNKTFRESLRQKNAALTFDEGIYCETKRIHWAISPELDNVIVQLRGFHRAKNFLGVIVKRMTESAVEDL